MAYQALYRKYRPSSFSDVVGQEHITKTLTNELSEGNIFHAYLFTGTRGTGKTSCAKILAKAVNCLNLQNGNPCCECEMCQSISQNENTDICEIDAASNNGVDNIRDIRERVNFAPGSSKYRVYIIDEVHMLSDGAFNALLKTIEEPPEHVIFILATTEVYKLPATILSRCQRFDFHRIDIDTISARIKYIAANEGFNITDGAATLIATAADGGMRDALSILDLCLAGSDGEITETTVTTVCGMAKQEYLTDLANFIKEKNCEDAITLLDNLYSDSVDMRYLLSELINHYRNLMIMKTVSGKNKPIVCSPEHLKALEEQAYNYKLSDIMGVLRVLQSSKADLQSGDQRLAMEMTVIRLCVPEASTDISGLELRISALEKSFSEGVAPKKAVTSSKKIEKIVKEPEKEVEEEAIPLPSDENEFIPEPPAEPQEIEETSASENTNTEGELNEWGEILNLLSRENPIVYSTLINSKAYLINNHLLIDTKDPLFIELYNMPTNRNFIKNAAEKVLGKSYPLGPYRKPKEETDPLKALAQRLDDIKSNGGN